MSSNQRECQSYLSLKRLLGSGLSFSPGLLWGCRALTARGTRVIVMGRGLSASTFGVLGMSMGSGSATGLSIRVSSGGWELLSVVGLGSTAS